MMKILESTIEKILKKRVKTQAGLARAKREVAKKYKIPCPSNIELLKAYHNLLKEKRIKKSKTIENLLRKRKIRSLSGVVVVSVLTKPYLCPGECIYCPIEEGIPKSYLSGEPAVERAKKLKFSPFLQTQKRIESLRKQGHPVDKIEMRIIGGSFSVYPKNYKIWFLANCFAAANKKEKISQKRINWEILEEQQKINEKSDQRIVGISIETRPDLINKKEILNLRKLGVTMVELGVQTVFDDILEKCKRGHGIEETILATRLLKDAGFKILYQMMPNLPGSDLKKDLKCFKEIFENENFKPDWLKIYPCVVCKGSELYRIWKKEKYRPYSNEKLIELLIKIKWTLPYWVRVARLFRDIPRQKIEAGCKVSNLREVVQTEMKKRGLKCKCIRCREVRKDYNPREKFYLFRENYDASGGKEIFLSFENKKRTKLFSFLRLRVPFLLTDYNPPSTLPSSTGPSVRPLSIIPVLRNAAIIREIQTYGQLVPISENYTGSTRVISPQHRGLGKRLIKIAEKIAKKEFSLKKIAAISGVGVRGYWRKLGYKLKETYVVKKI